MGYGPLDQPPGWAVTEAEAERDFPSLEAKLDRARKIANAEDQN